MKHGTQVLNGKRWVPHAPCALAVVQVATVASNAFGKEAGDVVQSAQVADQR